MDNLTLNLQKRTVTGKAVKRLRAEGMIPAVIHDHGKNSIVVMAPYMEMAKVYQQAGRNHPISVKTDSGNYTTLIKQVSVDPKKNRLTHVVFNAVAANEKVTAEVPVQIKFAEGNEATPAERAGLVVLHQLDTVEVEATPSSLPEALYFDGEKLVAVGDNATVADLIVPSGVTVKDEPGQKLATVFEPSALQAANDAAGGAAEEETATAETAEEAEAAEAKTEEKS